MKWNTNLSDFTDSVLCNIHNNPLKYILSLLYTEKIGGSKTINNFPQVGESESSSL